MKKHLKNGILYLVLFAVCFAGGGFLARKSGRVTVGASPQGGRLAIVIDDFGYDGEGTAEMLALPIPFTAAVMPFSHHSAEDGRRVQAAGKELFIHMPMESLTGKREWVGKKGLFLSMEETEIRQCVEDAFAVLPQAKGLNNHMGSAIMESEGHLRTVLQVLKEKNAVFLDSVTTAHSRGRALSEEVGICFLTRQVFLDSTDDIAVVKQNLRKAAEIAMKNGQAVAIGHVGPEGGKITAQALADLIPELEGAGITFVSAGELCH